MLGFVFRYTSYLISLNISNQGSICVQFSFFRFLRSRVDTILSFFGWSWLSFLPFVAFFGDHGHHFFSLVLSRGKDITCFYTYLTGNSLFWFIFQLNITVTLVEVSSAVELVLKLNSSHWNSVKNDACSTKFLVLRSHRLQLPMALKKICFLL